MSAGMPTTSPTQPSAQGSQGAGGMPDLNAFMQWLQSLGSAFGDGSQINTDQIAQALPFLSLYQQLGGQQYQQGYLQYLNQNLGLQSDQLNQAQQEMNFKDGPYWDWYTQVYFPQQQDLAQMGYQTQAAEDVANQGIAHENFLTQQQQTLASQEATKQAQYGTAVALANAYRANPLLRTNQTSGGRNVSGLAYSYGYPSQGTVYG